MRPMEQCLKSLTVPSILIVGTSITGNLFAINMRGVKKKKRQVLLEPLQG